MINKINKLKYIYCFLNALTEMKICILSRKIMISVNFLNSIFKVLLSFRNWLTVMYTLLMASRRFNLSRKLGSSDISNIILPGRFDDRNRQSILNLKSVQVIHTHTHNNFISNGPNNNIM